MQYGLAVLAFLATLVAIRGDTWDPARPGLRRLTATGLAAAVIALAALTLAVVAEHSQSVGEQADRRRQEELAALAKKTPYLASSSFVDIFAGNTWLAPDSIPAGAVVQFMGFPCTLSLEYGVHAVDVPSSAQSAVSVPIVSPFGELHGSRYRWGLNVTSSERRCSGFVYVYSTRAAEDSLYP